MFWKIRQNFFPNLAGIYFCEYIQFKETLLAFFEIEKYQVGLNSND